MLTGGYVLKTISSGTGGSTTAAGNTGSTTLTAAQSGVPAHGHGFTQPSVTGGGVSSGITGGSHNHAVANSYLPNGSSYKWAVNTTSAGGDQIVTETGGSHNHDLPSHTHTVSGGAVSQNTAQNASEGHSHTAGMPQNIGVYVWKRTA